MRIANIDILRGIAAISVTIFHLTGSSGLSTSIKEIGKYGYLGVEIFFVISGYILPYSMQKMNYHQKYFFKLLLKRIVRIDPPYLVIILITLLLIYITKRSIPSYISIFTHLGYLNGILNLEWISPTFWTLALEFQFYILIGLFYRIFIEKSIFLSLLTMVSILLLSFIVPSSFLPHHFGFFAMGILLFRFQIGKIPTLIFWLANLILVLFISYNNGLFESIIAFLTVIFILYFPDSKNILLKKCLLWLGMISYSLYLVHWEIGRAVIAVTKHIPLVSNFESLRLMVGIGASLLFAWFFFYLIESPSIKLSKRLKLINNAKTSAHN